jgi:hypothetical protein
MLIKLPETWPHPLVAALAMLVLAALDLAGAFAAKEASANRSPLYAGIGVLCFLLLFWVYASSLQYADLAPVTFGWIVFLQVGVLALDRWRYGARMPIGAWVAVVAILVAQAYLVLAPGATGPVPEQAPGLASSASGPTGATGATGTAAAADAGPPTLQE